MMPHDVQELIAFLETTLGMSAVVMATGGVLLWGLVCDDIYTERRNLRGMAPYRSSLIVKHPWLGPLASTLALAGQIGVILSLLFS